MSEIAGPMGADMNSEANANPWHIDHCYQEILMYQALHGRQKGTDRRVGSSCNPRYAAVWDVLKLIFLSATCTCLVQYVSLVLTSAILCYSTQGRSQHHDYESTSSSSLSSMSSSMGEGLSGWELGREEEDKEDIIQGQGCCRVDQIGLLVEYEMLSSLITAIFSWLIDCLNEVCVVNKYGMFLVSMLKSIPSFLTIRVGVVLHLPCVFNGPPSLGGIPFQPMAILLPTVLRRWCVTSQTQDFAISAHTLKI
ncbi:uncharacterized protein LOC134856026 [Symsagittifera roscoffensis]|uniref:uncharacterized protein LOC134856026 n=1 Tax=Symsagittifera roscoffensis TaxID=84072 RepID=UPI00307CAB7E